MLWLFFINSILLGVGLAMDAFSVSLANGLADPSMGVHKKFEIAGVFGGFQFLMPLVGWFFVHTLLSFFEAFQPWIPWIALALLLYIGIHMIRESREDPEEISKSLSLSILLMQGIATSIDALSAGFTIASYPFGYAFVACLIIGLVTFAICIAGLQIGKAAGTRFAGKAAVFGGCVLIAIGLEIFLTGVF